MVDNLHDGEMYEASRFIGHPGYNQDLIINDYAVAESAQPFGINEHAKPIPLVMPSTTRPADRHPLMTSGYGKYELNENGRPNPLPSRYLMYSPMEYVSVERCLSVWPEQTIDNSVICADNDGVSVCSGDSGISNTV